MKFVFMSRPNVMTLALAGVLIACAPAKSGTAPRGAVPPAPATDTVYTTTRQVTGIAARDSATWVGTLGGVLHCNSEGEWSKFTRLDGLPAAEVRGITINAAGEPEVLLPRARVRWSEGKWRKLEGDVPPPPNSAQLPTSEWNGVKVEATWTGLRLLDKGKWHTVNLPPSKGTHISALLPRGSELWVALFGDGLWKYAGGKWQDLDLKLPAEAREITALAAEDKTLWLGTRRAGVWEYADGK